MKEIELHDLDFLVERITSGDERAFSTLYDLFSPALMRHLITKVVDYDVAEDILHDLFLSLWKNRAQLKTIENLPAYLYSSCRYLVLAHYRKTMPYLHAVDVQEVDVLDESVSIEERLHYRYLIDMVANEIENLPEKCREVFKLSRNESFTNKEIAQKMEISESTVEKHITKAIRRLRIIARSFVLLF
ncbi:RNA polymerase sigma factor [Sphingobacterium sp. MYb382]|uniref:RNA polymerase sigma factor n=1 Tax=Sphingobacterium sp. MYb382 TaxID=2745278 RepID=UPI00309E1D62